MKASELGIPDRYFVWGQGRDGKWSLWRTYGDKESAMLSTKEIFLPRTAVVLNGDVIWDSGTIERYISQGDTCNEPPRYERA